MNDHELKTTLKETCPVLPGQEARAWSQLNQRLHKPAHGSWLTGRSLLAYGGATAVVLLFAIHFAPPTIEPVSASSQAPGIFATAFYSPGAHAQVVWLNGITPATDGPTSMDRTGQVDERASAHPSDDSL